MNINPFTLIQKGDIVELNELGLAYTSEEYKGLKFEVTQTYIDETEQKNCTEDNDGVPRPNCTCYRFFRLKMLGQDKTLGCMMFDELTLKEIKKRA